MKESEKIIRENCFKSRKDEEAVVCISDAMEAIELARKEERQAVMKELYKMPLDQVVETISQYNHEERK